MPTPKRIVILGSTGSIGKSTLDVVDNLGEQVKVVGLAAATGWEVMAEQVRRYKPETVVLTVPDASARLGERLSNEGIKTAVWTGPAALIELVKEANCDFVLSAIVGIGGLPATLAAVERGLTVGLANKESLVVAGALMVDAAKRSKA